VCRVSPEHGYPIAVISINAPVLRQDLRQVTGGQGWPAADITMNWNHARPFYTGFQTPPETIPVNLRML